jgi:hypothetical protein
MDMQTVWDKHVSVSATCNKYEDNFCAFETGTVLHFKQSNRNWGDVHVLYSDMSCFIAVFQVVHLHGAVHFNLRKSAIYLQYEVSVPGFITVENGRYLSSFSEVLEKSAILESIKAVTLP